MPTLASHSIDRPAMPPIEVHARRDDLQMKPAVPPDRFQNRFINPEFGARARDKADAAARRSGILRRIGDQLPAQHLAGLDEMPASAGRRSTGRAEAGIPVPGRCTVRSSS